MNEANLKQLFAKTAQVLKAAEADKAQLTADKAKLTDDLEAEKREKEVRALAKEAREYGSLGDDYDEVEAWVQEKTASDVSIEILKGSLEYGRDKLAGETASKSGADSMGRSERSNPIEELINGHHGE